MRKIIGYIPAVLFTIFYFVAGLSGASFAGPMILLWLICFWVSAFFSHKGFFWSGVFAILPSVHMICLGLWQVGQGVNIEVILGAVLIVFCLCHGFYLWKKRSEPKCGNREVIITAIKVVLTFFACLISASGGIILALLLAFNEINEIISFMSILVFPTLAIPMIWLKKRKKFFVIWAVVAVIYLSALGINYGMITYDKKITINTAPNIDVSEYLPFEEASKIVKRESETLKLTDNLPRIDGAAALFPVYSSFVNAVYPDTTELGQGVFEYNNTPEGYKLLAQKETDIFIGVYPSAEQRAYAEECNTTFEYTPIGTEAFVFFVHKNNPIDNLTTEQIKAIYSGEITNWKEVGGKDEEIAAFQRNKGSGSQSMLERFMGDAPIMEPPKELRNDMMSGVIEQVANYKSKSNSIGFSFRFYVEGIIKNPDIKMVSIDGVAPTAENIRNGKYPVVTPVYAVTYKEQKNENVAKLLEWILSYEGQRIIEETGYVGIMAE